MKKTLTLNQADQVDIFAGSGDDIIDFEIPELDEDAGESLSTDVLIFLADEGSDTESVDDSVLLVLGDDVGALPQASPIPQVALFRPVAPDDPVTDDAATVQSDYYFAV